MGWLSKTIDWLQRATEGSVRPGPWQLPVSGGWLSSGPPSYGDYWNWWQLGGNPIRRSSHSAMVEACISRYSQTVAQCPGDHWWRLDNGGRERVTNSALSRILRHPNDYQSISDFMLNLTRSLYFYGNAYALALRNDRYEVDELHLMDARQSSPALTSEDGDIFYHLAGNSIIDHRRRYLDNLGPNDRLLVPARDVLHVRLHTIERNEFPWPLIGETPLAAAYGAIEWYNSMRDQQKAFYDNQARPSAVLSTDLVLDKDQVQALRDRWNESTKGLHAGGVPILTSGLKVQQWNVPGAARDMQIAELLKLTQEQIALVFGIPLAVLGISDGAARTTQELMNFWLANGLGFCINHIEEAFGVLFQLRGQPDEYLEFNTSALLRSNQKERIEMLVRGVQGGVFSPNEARAQEDLPEVAYGEEPRVQQQVVPLSAAGAIATPGGGVVPGVEGPKTPSIPSAPPAPPSPPAGAATPARDEAQSKRLVRLSEYTKSDHLRLIHRAAARDNRRRSA